MIQKSIRISACALTLGLACALPVAAQNSAGNDARNVQTEQRGDKDWGWLGLLGLAGLIGLKRRDPDTTVSRQRTAM